MDDEVWVSCFGYEGLYEISNLGRVRSLDRVACSKGVQTRTVKGKILSLAIHHSGYIKCSLFKDGKAKNHTVHRLIALSFLGIPEDNSMQAAHLDGNRQNNKLSNIVWATPKENAAHKYIHGTANQGQTNPRAGLTNEQVLEIVSLSSVLPQTEIAKQFGVPIETVNHICTGRTWGSVTGIKYQKKHVTVTWELIDRMKDLAQNGLSLNAIAKELGVGSATVFRNYKRTRLDPTIIGDISHP